MILGACGCAPLSAYELDHCAVDRQAQRYRIDLRVRLAAAPADAYAAFADVHRLTRINPSVKQVRMIDGAAPGQQRVYTRVRVCVSFFCRELEQVQDMQHRAEGEGGQIHARVIPALSDLRFGEAHWTLQGCGDMTCLSFLATLEPGFWIPPLIGPWLIQRKLREEATETSSGIERAAQAIAAARS